MRQINNPSNSVPLTTLQGDVIFNQFAYPDWWIICKKTLIGDHGKAHHTVNWIENQVYVNLINKFAAVDHINATN